MIVTFRSGDVIERCLESLMASRNARLKIVVCDNASPDDTAERVRATAYRAGIDFAERDGPVSDDTGLADVTLVHTGCNLGFPAAVNIGLAALAAVPEVTGFWILNPDTVVRPDTATAFLRAMELQPRFALMGGRTLYLDPPNLIQSVGGKVQWWTGICRNIGRGLPSEAVPPPDPRDLDFISGANMVASRAFYEIAGPMNEDYFLYYDEVDWAARRGDLPLVVCEDAVVYHHGGTAIGSGSPTRRASPFANYFNFRNRMRFLRRFRPLAIPTAYLASLARIAKLLAVGAADEAAAALRGLHDLAPPAAVRRRIGAEASRLAFGRWG